MTCPVSSTSGESSRTFVKARILSRNEFERNRAFPEDTICLKSKGFQMAQITIALEEIFSLPLISEAFHWEWDIVHLFYFPQKGLFTG